MILSKNRILQLALLLLIIVSSCTQGTRETVVLSGNENFYRPEIDLGVLFHDVQMSGIFPDSKTFADYIVIGTPQEVVAGYNQTKSLESFDLAQFIEENFDPPPVPETHELEEFPETIEEHIPGHWDYLTRQPANNQFGTSSLIPLPFSYVVPGGRFREVYYWDSYFTMEGLSASNRWDLIESMLDNFAYLIDTIGFIPNGNRTYFFGRSQPPFFSSMVMLYAQGQGMESALKYLPQLEKEYKFWMQGSNRLGEDLMEYKRVVMLDTGVVLNRYWDDFPEPRPESYKEDYEMGEFLDEESRKQLFRDIRAACESGWDFSSRWFKDGSTLDSIITTQILPVDLNSLLLHLESTIGLMYEEMGNNEIAHTYLIKSSKRAQNIMKYFWDQETGFFQDYNYKTKRYTGILSLAGMYPFYFNIADRGQIDPVVEILKNDFMYEGGLVTTLYETGQQWDSPNGWAPLQWISVVGLANYDQDEMAFEISEKWVGLNQKVYASTRKMMEKYNVKDMDLEAGGGEYSTQDGFGWTNGVAIRLIEILEDSKVQVEVE